MKLTGADAAMVAIPLDSDMPATDVNELLVAETAGAMSPPAGEEAISVSGNRDRRGLPGPGAAAAR